MHCFSVHFALKVLGHSFTLQFIWKNKKTGKNGKQEKHENKHNPNFLCQNCGILISTQYWTNSDNLHEFQLMLFFWLRVCSAAYNAHFWCREILGLLLLCLSTNPPGFLCFHVPLWIAFRRRALLRLLNVNVDLHIQLMELYKSLVQLPDGCLVAVNLAWICFSAGAWWYFYRKST